MNKNKVQYNLRKVHYALLTEGENGALTYGVPIPVPGAVSLSINPVGDTKPFYADGIEYYTSTSNGGYEGDLELALIPEEFLTEILGEELSTVDKVLVENAFAKLKPFALLFEFEGDAKAIRRLMYNCLAKRPNMESSTSQDTIDVKPQKLSFKARPLSDGKIKAQTANETTKEAYDAWYQKVWQGTTDGETRSY